MHSYENSNPQKRTIYVGGLAEEVNEDILKAEFDTFGEIVGIAIPLDYETDNGKHRGFGFIEFESYESAAAAIDNMHQSEICNRTVRVEYARVPKVTDYNARPVWADDEWIDKYVNGNVEAYENNQ